MRFSLSFLFAITAVVGFTMAGSMYFDVAGAMLAFLITTSLWIGTSSIVRAARDPQRWELLAINAVALVVLWVTLTMAVGFVGELILHGP